MCKQYVNRKTKTKQNNRWALLTVGRGVDESIGGGTPKKVTAPPSGSCVTLALCIKDLNWLWRRCNSRS